MALWLIVVLVVVVLVLLLAAGGALVMARRSDPASLDSELRSADRALATARASDRGWEPALLQAAARAAHTVARPGEAIETLELVQVIDMPGTDADQARFRVNGSHEILLGRTGDTWAQV